MRANTIILDSGMSEEKKVTEPKNVDYELFKPYEKWYKYAVTQTFKDGTDYVEKAPVKASNLYKTALCRYARRMGVFFYYCPDLSEKGRFHFHGVVVFPPCEYEEHETHKRVFRNYCNRKFGLSYWQVIQTFKPDSIYNVQGNFGKKRFFKPLHELQTSFRSIMEYASKTQNKLEWLKVVTNMPQDATD